MGLARRRPWRNLSVWPAANRRIRGYRPDAHAFDVAEHVAADRHFPTRLRGAPESLERAAQVRSGPRGLAFECLSDGLGRFSNRDGELVRSADLLGRRPLVITFFRGR